MGMDVSLFPVVSSSNGVRLLFGSFTPANGASPTASTVRGNWIESVTRTAEGLWTIQMKARFLSSFNLLGVFAQYGNATADAGAVSVAETSLSAGTIKLAGWLAHVADDLAANTPTICVMVVVQSNNAKDGGGF